MMIIQILTAVARKAHIGILVAGLLCGGCASHSVHPEVGSVRFSQRERSPVPFNVGIIGINHDFPPEVGNQGKEFRQRLEEAALFRQVYYPLRPGDQLDATLELSYVSTDTASPGTITKGTVGLSTLGKLDPSLPCQSGYQVDVTLTISQGSTIINCYTASGFANADVKSRRPTAECNALRSAIAQTHANLIDQLVRDRAFVVDRLRPYDP